MTIYKGKINLCNLQMQLTKFMFVTFYNFVILLLFGKLIDCCNTFEKSGEKDLLAK